jgi:hypothetical protein
MICEVIICVATLFETTILARPASIPLSFSSASFSGASFSSCFAGHFAASGFVGQLRQQRDRRWAGADQEPLALELDHGDKASVAEGCGFANRERLVPASGAAGQYTLNH